MQQKYKSLLISRTRKAKMDASEKKKKFKSVRRTKVLSSPDFKFYTLE